MDVPHPAPTVRQGPDRFLIGILIGLVALLVVAGASIFFISRPQQDFPAGTPSGTVQRFLLAIDKQDYNQAYDYLSDNMESKPTREEFVRGSLNRGHYSDRQERIRIDSEKTYGDQSTVTVGSEYSYGSTGPFGGSYTYSDTYSFSLQREQGTWKITYLPYPYMP